MVDMGDSSLQSDSAQVVSVGWLDLWFAGLFKWTLVMTNDITVNNNTVLASEAGRHRRGSFHLNVGGAKFVTRDTWSPCTAKCCDGVSVWGGLSVFVKDWGHHRENLYVNLHFSIAVAKIVFDTYHASNALVWNNWHCPWLVQILSVLSSFPCEMRK